MIIIIKKDGTVITDDGNPVDIKALDNAAMLLADPQNGDTIVYDASAGCWVAGEGGGFSPDITNPQDGDTLVYDASEEKWVNGAGGGGGGYEVIENGIGLLDKTWSEISTAFNSGKIVYITAPMAGMEGITTRDFVKLVASSQGTYAVLTLGDIEYDATAESGHPEKQR